MIRRTTLGIVGALAVGLFGCSGTPPGEFIIVQNQVPNTDCTIPATKGAIYRGEGTLDVRLSSGYALFPLLENDFPGAMGQGVEANRIALSGFDVEIGLPENAEPGPIADLINMLQALPPDDPGKALVQYSTLTSGSVASGGGNTASSVDAFPGDLADRIRALGLLSPTKTYWVLSSVRARGNTLVSSVRSDAFKYPIELCDGCLTFDSGTCSATPTATTSCTPGQDGFVGCCELAGQLVCR